MPDVLFPRYGDTDLWILVSINGIDHSFRAGEVVTVSDAVLAALDESHYAYDEHGGLRYPGYERVSDGGGGDPGSPPEGMAFLFAENGEPILNQDGAQVYALESA